MHLKLGFGVTGTNRILVCVYVMNQRPRRTLYFVVLYPVVYETNLSGAKGF
jgi:hypothetical protein